MTTIEQIEEFFGAKFLLVTESNPEWEDILAGTHIRELLHFDGFMHRHLILDDKQMMLVIRAGATPREVARGRTVMDMDVFFGGASLEMDSGESILKIHPNNTYLEDRFLWFTRHGGGRISFRTSFGDEPDSY